MISSKPLLLLTILSCIYLSFLQLVNADAVDDLWNKYMQQADTSSQQAKSYESTITRRERNLDHWDVPTAAAYLGLHPETLQPLPKYASDVSTSQDTTASSNSLSSTTQTSQQQTDEYIGHDAAILFYAQWCRNCHAVAPSWDAIATHINAGSKSSNIVMALFDCEKNNQATQLCLNAGITAYPTIMFVGRTKIHDTDFLTKSILGKDKSAGPYGATTLDRTVKFQGNWQYADQILDWISIMKGISYWGGVTDSGPLRGVRNVLFGLLTGGKYNKNKGRTGKGGGSLPVGVPPNFQPELRGIGGSSGGGGSSTVDAAASAQEVKSLELKLNATTEEKKLYEKAVSHSSQLLNGMLFPTSKNDTQEGAHRDVFTILTKSDGWYSNATSLPNEDTSNDEHPSILRSCALELSIDYCTRITTRETNKYLEVLSAIPESDPFPSLEEIEGHLLDEVKKQEPYCGIIETCMVSNFEELEECRPEICPFVNDAACTYLESCLDPTVQAEYGVALGLIKEGEKVMDKDFSGVASGGTVDNGDAKASESKGKTGVGGWGVPV